MLHCSFFFISFTVIPSIDLCFFQVKFDLYQVKRNKQFIAKNIENVLAFNAMTNGRREHNYNIRKEREMRRSTTTTTTSNDNVVKQMHRGYVVSLKDGFGFIEMLNYEKEIYFNFRYLKL